VEEAATMTYLPTTASFAISGDLPLQRVAAFLGNILEAARWFKLAHVPH
jgi:hypothetical protein